MAELKGSNTEKNLQTAFAGESQAFQKYTYYAAAARKAGMNEIADYFEETAHNESAHAKVWFKALHGGEAEKEGFTAIAFKMREVGKIEARHEARYLALAARVSGNKVFHNDQPVAWICANCGYIHVGEEAPKVCPVCAHPQAFFQRHVESI